MMIKSKKALRVVLIGSLSIIAYYLYYFTTPTLEVFIIDENHYMFWVLLFFQIFNVVLIFIELRSLPKET